MLLNSLLSFGNLYLASKICWFMFFFKKKTIFYYIIFPVSFIFVFLFSYILCYISVQKNVVNILLITVAYDWNWLMVNIFAITLHIIFYIEHCQYNHNVKPVENNVLIISDINLIFSLKINFIKITNIVLKYE